MQCSLQISNVTHEFFFFSMNDFFFNDFLSMNEQKSKNQNFLKNQKSKHTFQLVIYSYNFKWLPGYQLQLSIVIIQS